MKLSYSRINLRYLLLAATILLLSGYSVQDQAHAQDNNLICPPVEVVFAVDTSGSMDDEASELCASISAVQGSLVSAGVSATTYIYGITQDGQQAGTGFECLTDSVANAVGTTIPGDDGTCGGTLDHSESWGQATSVLSSAFPWSEGAVRVVVPVSDEGACRGNSCQDPGDDRDAIINATALALANDVVVSPISGTGAGECVNTLGQDIANDTGGVWFQSTDPSLDLAGAVYNLILSACEDAVIDVECTDSDQQSTLAALDGLALQQRKLTRKLVRVARRKGAPKRAVRRILNQANEAYLAAWTTVWTNPDRPLFCSAAEVCTQSSLASLVAETSNKLEQGFVVTKRAKRLLNRYTTNNSRRRGRRILASAKALLSSANQQIATLAQVESVCDSARVNVIMVD